MHIHDCITKAEAARLANRTRPVIERAVKDGTLRGYTSHCGNVTLIPLADVEAWVATIPKVGKPGVYDRGK